MSRRVLVIGVLAALVLVGLGIVTTLRLLDARDLLAGRLSAIAGREVVIEKPVELRLGLPPVLHLEGVRVGESAEGSPLRSVYVGQLDLGFKLWPLMRGFLEVRRLEVDDVEVVLEPSISQEGERTDSDAGGSRPYWVEQADVRNLRIELRHTGGAKTTARIEHVRLRTQAEGQEVKVEARGAIEQTHFTLSGRYQQSPSLSGETRREGLAQTHIEGALSESVRPGQRPRFTGTIEVPELHLEDLGVGSRRTSEVAGAPEDLKRGGAPTRRLFSDARVELAWLQIADARLSFRADHILGSSGPFARDVRLDATLEDGKISLTNVAFGYEADATGKGEFELDSRVSPPTISVRAEVKGMHLERVLEQLDLPRAYAGSLQARVDLKTQGDSPLALAAHLDGTIGLTCDGGTIYAEYQSLQMRDLYRAARRVVGGDRDSQPFNCLIAGVEFRAGVGSALFLLDADDHTTVGEGRVDLAAETIELRLVPKPHKASLLSTAATVEVVGPLTNPEVKVVKQSLVTSTTRAIFANLASASGARQIWQRLGMNTPVDSPCAKLMGSAP